MITNVIAVAALLSTGCFTAEAQTQTAARASVPVTPAQVIIIGTIHGAHKTNTNYSTDVLRNLIVALKPAAILVELPPEIRGQQTVSHGRVTKGLDGPEDIAANAAAEALSVNVIPFDREGRNEFYQRTRFFAREHGASVRFNDWLETQARQQPGSIAVLAARLRSDAITSEGRFNGGGPERLNSAAYDMVVATKHGITYGIIPKLLAASGQWELHHEHRFLADEWQERNEIMARNIRGIAGKFAGQRLVVLTGSSHRYLLRELLANAPELELKEFYQVAGWTEGLRATH